MPQSLAQVYLHIIFSTQQRQPFLLNPATRGSVHAYLAGILQNLETPASCIGGVEDHVHILCRFGRTRTISDVVRDCKRDSSKWIKSAFSDLAAFDWQNGYGTFSISSGHVEALREYITHQEHHHQRETFQEEYRRLLEKHNLEYDERYVWD